MITSDRIWLESNAVRQLEQVSDLPGVVAAVGFPDLHAGRTPVGIAVMTDGVLYPHLIGNDIGCGMGLFETPLSVRRVRLEKLTSKLETIRDLAQIPLDTPCPEDCPIPDLGTLGGGNHFAEFQQVEDILDGEAFAKTGLDRTKVMLLIHSGSRSLGQRIFTRYCKPEGLPLGSEEAASCLREHEEALRWAKMNRSSAAGKLLRHLGCQPPEGPVLDSFHNYLEADGKSVLHRKGAAGANRGPVVIPGSRGTLTYIVEPLDCSGALDSLSHGAGRKWARSMCKSRIKGRYDRNSIRRNPFGGSVICRDTDLLFEEAPEVYKNISHIIACLVDRGLCRVIATLRPLATFKG